MARLTDRRTTADLKANAESLRALGIEPSILDRRYIKLSEYEDVEELIKTATHAPVLSYQTAAIKAALEGKGVKYGKWIKGKHWDEWFCSVCHKRAYLDCKENPILSYYCPHCGARNCIGHSRVDEDGEEVET